MPDGQPSQAPGRPRDQVLKPTLFLLFVLLAFLLITTDLSRVEQDELQERVQSETHDYRTPTLDTVKNDQSLLLAAAPKTKTKKGTHQTGEHYFELLYTSRTNGNIDPCGCFILPRGGIARRHAFINGYRHTKSSFLLMDTGNVPASVTEIGIIDARTVFKAMNVIGYDAGLIAEGDLLLPLGIQRETLVSVEFPVLATNIDFKPESGIKVEDTGKKGPVRAVFTTKAGVRIGIFGAVSDRTINPVQQSRSSIRIEEPVKRLREIQKQFKDKFDFGIVLESKLNEEEIKAISKLGPFRVLIGTDFQNNFGDFQVSQPERRPNLLYMRGGEEDGKSVDQLQIALTGDLYFKKVGFISNFLSPKYKSTREMDGLLNENKVIKQKLLKEQEAITLKVKATNRYVGSASCKSCHLSQYKHWSGTQHSTAFTTLVKDKKADHPDCISCHVVGHLRPSGYTLTESPRSLINVGCESCHGPGERHIRAAKGANFPDKDKFVSRGKDKAVCISCHDLKHSGLFEYKRYLQKVTH